MSEQTDATEDRDDEPDGPQPWAKALPGDEPDGEPDEAEND